MKANDWEKIFGKLFLTVIACLLVLAFTEVVSRVWLGKRRSTIENQYPTDISRSPKPYVMFGGVPHGKVWAGRLNRLGYVDNVPANDKRPDEFRIIILGGSELVMGKTPIPRLLEQKFRESGCGGIRIYNFGVISSVTGMELTRLVHDAVDYHPDMIISYSGFNDIDQPLVADPRPGYPLNFIIYENNPILESNVDTYPLIPLMLYGSNLARHLIPDYFERRFIPLERTREEARYGEEIWRKNIADIYVKNIVKSWRIAKAFDAHFMAFFQPSLYSKEHLSSEETKFIDTDRRDHFLSTREALLTAMDRLPGSGKPSFIDLSHLYNAIPETVFADRVHTLQAYKAMVAEKMFESIKEYLTGTEGIAILSICGQ